MPPLRSDEAEGISMREKKEGMVRIYYDPSKGPAASIPGKMTDCKKLANLLWKMTKDASGITIVLLPPGTW